VAGGEKENLEDLLLWNLELMAGAGSYFYQCCLKANVIELPLYDWLSLKSCICYHLLVLISFCKS
jgi:hypothetical protein